MNWTNIQLIVSREIRDQLRDRRTIFVIAILPLLLYPLLGMSFLQVAQFMRQHPTKIWLIGTENLPAEPELLVNNSFRQDLLLIPGDAKLFDISTEPLAPGGDVAEVADAAVSAGKYDAVVYFSPDFGEQVDSYAKSKDGEQTNGDEEPKPKAPGPEVFYDISKDKSRVAYDRTVVILQRWRSDLVEKTLTKKELPKPPQSRSTWSVMICRKTPAAARRSGARFCRS